MIRTAEPHRGDKESSKHTLRLGHGEWEEKNKVLDREKCDGRVQDNSRGSMGGGGAGKRGKEERSEGKRRERAEAAWVFRKLPSHHGPQTFSPHPAFSHHSPTIQFMSSHHAVVYFTLQDLIYLIVNPGIHLLNWFRPIPSNYIMTPIPTPMYRQCR